MLTATLPQRRAICFACRERPKGCWQAATFASPRDRIRTGHVAALQGRCPVGKWGGNESSRGSKKPKRDMTPKLFQPTKGPVDVVYFLGNESKFGDDWEIRMSLRSVVANFKDLGRVFVVGCRPTWMHNVEFISWPDYHKHNKDANLIDKLHAACRWGASSWFLSMSDDHLILRPVSFRDCKAYYSGDLLSRPISFWGGGSWKDRLKRTAEWLDNEGFPAFMHDTHCPIPVHRETYMRAMSSLDYAPPPGYTVFTLYCNMAPIEREPLNGLKVTYEHECHAPLTIRRELNGPLFCGYNNVGLTDEFKAEIERRFPEPSPFEKRPRFRTDTLRRVSLCGSDSQRVFGGLYEGGYGLQQVPSEAAELLELLELSCAKHPRLIEVGSAEGGLARLLDDELACSSIAVLDDNQHPKHSWRPRNLPHLTAELVGPAQDAGPWLRQRDEQYDLVIIDTSHLYEHEKAHVEVVRPHVAPGGLMAFHDSVVCHREHQVGRLLREMKAGMYPELRHVADIGDRLGWCVFQRVGEQPNSVYKYPDATLLFHFAPWLPRAEMIEFHVRCLSRYLHQFSKVRVNFVTGDEFMRPDQIEPRIIAAARPGTDIKFFYNAHSPAMHGETVPFFEHLLPETGDDDFVCYAHSKGAMISPQPKGRAWAEMMYAHCLQNSRAAIKVLSSGEHDCYGAFKAVNDWRGTHWHYEGTFFWFRGVRRYAGWERRGPRRYGVEAWLGRFVPVERAYETAMSERMRHVIRDASGLYSALPWGPDDLNLQK